MTHCVPFNQHRLSWQDYFFSMAIITSLRSPDPNTQVGACIVDNKKRIIGLGYNGLVRGMENHQINWARVNDKKEDTKYPFIVHAEINAIYNSSKELSDTHMYCTMHPCPECAKSIAQNGITAIYYLSDSSLSQEDLAISKKILDFSDVVTQKVVLDTCGLGLVKEKFSLLLEEGK